MHGHLARFAFNPDDVPATLSFYEQLFGWSCEDPYPRFLGAGELAFLSDPAGNVVGTMRFS